MSINPVPITLPANDLRVSDAASRPKDAQSAATLVENSFEPVSGTQPKQNSSKPSNVSAVAEPLQDEVDLQHDSQTGGDIIVQYKDQSGNLILQLPTPQVLGVARGIYQDFRAEAKARAVGTQTGNERGNRHGD
jgi:hypothetical protein